MAERICIVDGCGRPHDARGLCSAHYRRAMRSGEIARLPTLDVEERLFAHVEQRGECLVWTGDLTPHGYGRISVDRRYVQTHRLAWELRHGPIPAETPNVLHHCDNPPCLLDEHLFLGTQADNLADMAAKGRGRPLIRNIGTECVRGHLLDEANAYHSRGRVHCRRCRADYMRETRRAAGGRAGIRAGRTPRFTVTLE